MSINNQLNLTKIKTMKKYFLILALTAITSFGIVHLRAQDATNAAPAAPAAPEAPALPAASLDQRIAALESYIGNGDPTASLTKDTNGNFTAISYQYFFEHVRILRVRGAGCAVRL